MCSLALKTFQACIDRCQHMLELYNWLEINTSGALYKDDLLRSCYVLGVSGLDSLFVELCTNRFLRICEGEIPKTGSFAKIKLDAQSVLEGRHCSEILKESYYKTIIHRSYQHPEQIRKYVKEIYDGDFWKDVAREMGYYKKDVEGILENIVERRNRIAHAGDVDPTYGFVRSYNINADETKQAVDFLISLGFAVVTVLN